MGGFVLDFTEVLDQQSPGLSPENAFALDRLAAEMVLEDERIRINSLRMRHKGWALINDPLERTHHYGLFQTLPQVSKILLERLNKGDPLVKTLALIQVTWLIIQLIARKISKLPSSQLEIAAIAFSVYSIVTYLIYWNRPHGVETIWSIKASRLPTQSDMRGIAECGPFCLWTGERGESRVDSDYDLVPLPNDSSVDVSDNKGVGLILAVGAIIGGTVFGGLHCLAWNFHFPITLLLCITSSDFSFFPSFCEQQEEEKDQGGAGADGENEDIGISTKFL